MRPVDLDEIWQVLPGISRPGRALPSAPILDDLPRSIFIAETGPVKNDILLESTPLTAFDKTDSPEASVSLRITAARDQLASRSRSAMASVGRFDTSAAMWLSTGFMAGMISWHAIGFWGFVTETVLKSDVHGVVIAATTPPPAIKSRQIMTASLTTGSISTPNNPAVTSCVALVVNRTSGETSTKACDSSDVGMRDAGRRRRTDRLVSVDAQIPAPNDWTTTAQTEPASSKPDPGTLAATDFDLSLTSGTER